MISTNEISNTVSFTTSEVFNSDNLSNQPPIEGRSSAALAACCHKGCPFLRFRQERLQT